MYIHEVSSTYKLLYTNGVTIGNSADITNLSFEAFVKPLDSKDIYQNIIRINQLFRIEEKESVLEEVLNY
ncbi:hypothetical protein D3C78_1759650 [compost metagenome]